LLTDDEDEEGGGDQEADVARRAAGLARGVRGPVHAIVVAVLDRAVAGQVVVCVHRQLRLHVAVVPLHVLREVEARVRVRLPIELRQTERWREGGREGGREGRREREREREKQTDRETVRQTSRAGKCIDIIWIS